MTKKDFKIAEAIRKNSNADRTLIASIGFLYDFYLIFKEDNSNFDKTKFLEACSLYYDVIQKIKEEGK